MATASGRQFLEAKCNSVLATPLSTSFSILLAGINMERGVSIFLSHVIIMPMTLECHNPTEQHGPKGKYREITERRELSVNPGFTCYCIFETFFLIYEKMADGVWLPEKWLGLHSVSLGEDQPQGCLCYMLWDASL